MNDYISREAVFQVVHGIARGISDKYIEALNAKDTRAFYKAKGAKEILDSVATDLCYVPVADVQPVKHGKWEETHISLCKWIPEDEKQEGHSFYMAELKCSCCERYNAVTFALTLNKPDFCQLCGARMDGDTNG